MSEDCKAVTPHIGRPRLHDRALVGAQLYERLATGMLVKDACAEIGVDQTLVWQWAADDESFYKIYARAREAQAHALAEQALALADDEAIPADSRRIRVDTRKWYTSKIAPRFYGDRQTIEHQGETGLVIRVVKE